ncbi:thioredoxin family protein [Halococcoides cellulosivorans]|uniref:Thioredoxin n=1 Tax=Halococcoides cellulosivorans TaxID=1679096 RepID=A0A2R4X306_9EURY|nr:thioredoxin family protein [Halococcoides cellulosivorans]AWB28186.1 thioredoxin [Halococcoides cellulosivorans]
MAQTFDADDPPDRPVALDDGDALDALIDTYETVLVEFYTDGCGVCASMEPVLGIVAQEADAVVATINPRDDPPLVERFAVQSVPLLVVFRDGEPVERVADGFQPADDVIALIDAAD